MPEPSFQPFISHHHVDLFPLNQGYTLSNMKKMIQSHYDYHERPMLGRQLDEIEGELHMCGWDRDYHPGLVAHLIKKFGTFPTNTKAKSAARKRGKDNEHIPASSE